jgi:very-short-patch-repair endonuclease
MQRRDGNEKMYSIKQIALVAAKDLRNNQTEAEKVYWNNIKDKNIFGNKFWR